MATALVGALLSATLVAIGRHTHQVRLAQDRIAALEIADGLLRLWLVDGVEPEGDEGVVPGGAASGSNTWRWRLRGERAEGLEAMGAHLGRVEIINPEKNDLVLAALEFVSTSPITAAYAGVR